MPRKARRGVAKWECLSGTLYRSPCSGVWLAHFRLQFISGERTMLGKPYRSLSALASFVAVLLGLTIVVSSQTGQPSTANGEWPTYNADLRGTRYSPLDQINASNFNKLEIAWRFKTDKSGTIPGIQTRRHAVNGQRRFVHDRRNAALGRCAGCQNRRDDLGAQLS